MSDRAKVNKRGPWTGEYYFWCMRIVQLNGKVAYRGIEGDKG